MRVCNSWFWARGCPRPTAARGTGRDLQHSSHQTDPHRHSLSRDRKKLQDGDRGAVADVKNALKVILLQPGKNIPKASRTEVISAIASYKQDFEKQSGKFVKSDQISHASRKDPGRSAGALPQDGYAVTDVGWNKNGVGQQFPIYVPGTFIRPREGFAPWGYGPPAAPGVKLCMAPTARSAALIGDGAMGESILRLGLRRSPRYSCSLGGHEQRKPFGRSRRLKKPLRQ